MANNYNPDVLNCIANLSNDEVFTPPTLANQVLDLLPQKLFTNPKTTFLDPFTKSGVFLREIVKRLDRGLETQIPDRQQRIDHIMHKQVYGIACTELTAHLSRRSLYCSKHPDGKHSVSRFENPEGNIQYKTLKHTWEGNKCKFCGASKEVYDRGDEAEQYAYQFIHTTKPESIFNMKFDVIIGNPPYQLNDGGGTGSSSKPLYDKFVEQAKRIGPRYLIMIIPSRWMTGGKGLDSFRQKMIKDRNIRVVHDFLDSGVCFSGVNIEGGVCFFLWNSLEKGKCEYYIHRSDGEILKSIKYLDEGGSTDIVLREPNIVGILDKVQNQQEKSFSSLVSTRNPFKITEPIEDIISETSSSIRILCRYNGHREVLNVRNGMAIEKGKEYTGKYKLFISKADGAAGQIGNPIPARIIGKAEYGERDMICSETFLAVGPFQTKTEMNNVSKYMQTKFFRFLVGIRKNKNMTSDTYLYAPLQDFSHPWTDEMLYKKYGLTQEEIDFIESMIRPME